MGLELVRTTETKLTPLTPAIGAEITGLDLADLTDAEIDDIGLSLARHGVLVIRGQAHLTPYQQVDFSRRLGPLEQHVLRQFLLPGYPEILVVSNVIENGKPIGLGDAGRYWHSDLSYLAEPSLGSALLARELPRDGGDTLFASLAAAYDALDEATKQRLSGLVAVHDYAARSAKQAADATRPALTADQERQVPPVVHPVVRQHPVTGRPALFVTEGFTTHILGLSDAESRALLDQLFAHSKDERFIYRHRWQSGDLLLWDNRATMHLATGCPADQRRTLHRTTIRGDIPKAYH